MVITEKHMIYGGLAVAAGLIAYTWTRGRAPDTTDEDSGPVNGLEALDFGRRRGPPARTYGRGDTRYCRF